MCASRGAAGAVCYARPPSGEGTARPGPRIVAGMERGATAVACALLLAFAACPGRASGQGKRSLSGIPRKAPDLTGSGRGRDRKRTEGTAAGQGSGQGGGTGAAPGGALRLLSEGRAGAPFLRPATEQPQT